MAPPHRYTIAGTSWLSNTHFSLDFLRWLIEKVITLYERTSFNWHFDLKLTRVVQNIKEPSQGSAVHARPSMLDT